MGTFLDNIFYGKIQLNHIFFTSDHSEITAKVTITDGKQRAGGDQLPEDIFNVYEAVLPLPNCASPTGCRQTVMTSDDHSKPDEFMLTETVDIKFEATGPEGAWIEYVLAVPNEEFDQPLLVADDTVDRRREFVKECGRNDFYVPDTVEGNIHIKMDIGFLYAKSEAYSGGQPPPI